MSHAGEIFENVVTGERGVIRVGTDDSTDGRLVAELFIDPGGRVAAAHTHRDVHERFTIVSGNVGLRLGRRELSAEIGRPYDVVPGTVHDSWNAGDSTAHIVVEITPGRRFEELIRTTFGLANDGLTDRRGMPGLLQLSLLATEFDDVIAFTRPPRVVQRALFGALAPVARRRGLRGTYARYRDQIPRRIEVEPWRSPMDSALDGPPAALLTT